MRVLASLITFLSVSVSFACPDLAGNWHCTGDNGNFSEHISITQQETNGVTTYNYNNGEYEFVADSVERLGPFGERVVASCVGVQLQIGAFIDGSTLDEYFGVFLYRNMNEIAGGFSRDVIDENGTTVARESIDVVCK